MKKFAFAVLISISCLAFVTGCSFFDPNNESQLSKLTPMVALSQSTTDSGATLVDCRTDPGNPACNSSGSGSSQSTFYGPSIVNATDGEYTDKVGVDWSPVEGAVRYNVYRAEGEQGPFSLLGSVNASDITDTMSNFSYSIAMNAISSVIKASVTGATCNDPILQYTYQSNVDLNQVVIVNLLTWQQYRGVYLWPGETCSFRVKIGDSVNVVCSFYGGLFGNYIQQDDVISKINQRVGRTVCYAVNDDTRKYIKIVSSEPIVLENYRDIIWYLERVPLRLLLQSNATWDTVLTVEPVQIGCNDSEPGTIPPSVLSTTPDNGDTNVALATSLTAVFSEAVNCSTLTTSSFALMQGSASVSGVVACSGTTATFTPSANLASNSTYTATITTAVQDLDGIPMTLNYAWSFSTSSPTTTPPRVSIPTPANGATDVAIDTIVTADFNENIDCATVTESSFTLAQDGAPVAGTVICSGSTGTFIPAANLARGTTYTATVTTAVKDPEGTPMTMDYSWSFKTEGSPVPGSSHYFIDTLAVQGVHYYYVVTAVNNLGDESAESSPDEGYALSTSVPGKIEELAIASGIYTDRVVLAWLAPQDATYYRVFRSDGTGYVQISGDVTATTYEDTTIQPGLFAYKVYAYNSNGQGGNSDPEIGYRAVSNLEFFHEAFKEEGNALGKLTTIGQLTTETVYDKDGDGTCVYTAKLVGLEGQGAITFTNYCDFYLALDGEQKLTIDASLSGRIANCRMNVSGVYRGYIDFVNITIAIVNEGIAITGGSYSVSQNGQAATTIPYTETPSLP